MNNKIVKSLLASSLVLSSLPLSVMAADGETERLGGVTRVETSNKVSNKAYDEADTVVIAGYDGFADALTGNMLAAKHEAPLLLISDYASDIDSVKAEINRLGANKAILLGQESVIGENVVSELEAEGVNVTRKGGLDRFDTAVDIAKEAGDSHERVFLTVDGRSGELADALSAGPVSARDQDPILLTSKDEVPTQTFDALKDLDVKEVTIVGGKAAVSGKVKENLENAGYTVSRVAGDDRWETATEVAGEYFAESDKAILANDGRSSYADALVGGYFGAKEEAPIILTETDRLNSVTESYLEDEASFAYILGEYRAVSEDVRSAAERALAKTDDESEELTVESVKAITSTTLEVTLSDDSEHTVELDEALEDGKATTVRFEIDEKEYTATVTWNATTNDKLAEAKAELAEAKDEQEAAHKIWKEKDQAVKEAEKALDQAELDWKHADEDEKEAALKAVREAEKALEDAKADRDEAWTELEKSREEVSELETEVKELEHKQRVEAVEKAEEFKTQTAVDEAKELLIDENKALHDRLNEVQDKIDAAVDAIAAISTPVTLDDKDAIEKARTAVDALGETGSTEVKDLDVLEAAEKRYAKLHAEEATEDLPKAEDVVFKNKEQIEGARDRVETAKKLGIAEKDIKDIEKLEAAEAALEELQNISEAKFFVEKAGEAEGVEGLEEAIKKAEEAIAKVNDEEVVEELTADLAKYKATLDLRKAKEAVQDLEASIKDENDSDKVVATIVSEDDVVETRELLEKLDEENEKRKEYEERLKSFEVIVEIQNLPAVEDITLEDKEDVDALWDEYMEIALEDREDVKTVTEAKLNNLVDKTTELANEKAVADAMALVKDEYVAKDSSEARTLIADTIDNDDITVTVAKSTGNKHLVTLTHTEGQADSKLVTIKSE